ncbi:MAG: hypothetical protein GY870_13220, partial [archaeon]|nr:hypothetical protein [archaeon]
MTSKNENKTEKIRNSYDKTADFYDARYEPIQFIKYSLLLPKIWDIKIYKNKKTITFLEPILDYGGGSGLFLKYLGLISIFFKKQHKIDKINKIYGNLSTELLLLFEHISKEYGISSELEKDIEFLTPSFILCDISYQMVKRS